MARKPYHFTTAKERKDILYYHRCRISSRTIAELTLISKTNVQRIINKFKETNGLKKD